MCMIPSGPPPIKKRDVELNETQVRPSYNAYVSIHQMGGCLIYTSETFKCPSSILFVHLSCFKLILQNNHVTKDLGLMILVAQMARLDSIINIQLLGL